MKKRGILTIALFALINMAYGQNDLTDDGWVDASTPASSSTDIITEHYGAEPPLSNWTGNVGIGGQNPQYKLHIRDHRGYNSTDRYNPNFGITNQDGAKFLFGLLNMNYGYNWHTRELDAVIHWDAYPYGQINSQGLVIGKAGTSGFRISPHRGIMIGGRDKGYIPAGGGSHFVQKGMLEVFTGHEFSANSEGDTWGYKTRGQEGIRSYTQKDDQAIPEPLDFENLRIYSGGTYKITNLDAGDYQYVTNFAVYGDGLVRAREIIVDADPNWPDYVFDEKYKLASLDEISEFIEENNHLPGIPSQEQIYNEGLNLGEMDKLLLEKIEEITLYLIEQNSKIDELERLLNQKK